MLSEADQENIASGFNVYEHEWRFFAGFMGEPFLLNNRIVYWDGSVANVCSFPLGGDRTDIDVESLGEVLSALPGTERLGLIHVWGRLDLPETVAFDGRVFRSAEPRAIGERHAGEHTVDIRAFGLGSNPEAAKAVRSLGNKGIEVAVERIDRFRAHHYRLVEIWRRTRPIGMVAACATTTLPGYCRESGVFVLEACAGGRILGFGIIARPVEKIAVLMWSFSEKEARIEDALMHGAINFCIENGIDTLHCGYAGTASLARFKEKWSARKTGPDFGQTVYAVSDRWLERARLYQFYWAIRLLDEVS